jgi:predicted TPR repeat methyltransferase
MNIFAWRVTFNDGHTYERYTKTAKGAAMIMLEYLRSEELAQNKEDIYVENLIDNMADSLDEFGIEDVFDASAPIICWASKITIEEVF